MKKEIDEITFENDTLRKDLSSCAQQLRQTKEELYTKIEEAEQKAIEDQKNKKIIE